MKRKKNETGAEQLMEALDLISDAKKARDGTSASKMSKANDKAVTN